MARTAQQWANQRAAQSAQIGISGEEYDQRQAALRTPEFNSAAFGGAGNTIRPDVLSSMRAGGTMADTLGKGYEFLGRGGFGAPATGTRAGFQAGLGQQGFGGVKPMPTPAGGPTPAGARPGGGAMSPMGMGKNMPMPAGGATGPSAAYGSALGKPPVAGAPSGVALAGASGTAGATPGGFGGVRPAGGAARGLRTRMGQAQLGRS